MPRTCRNSKAMDVREVAIPGATGVWYTSPEMPRTCWKQPCHNSATMDVREVDLRKRPGVTGVWFSCPEHATERARALRKWYRNDGQSRMRIVIEQPQ